MYHLLYVLDRFGSNLDKMALSSATTYIYFWNTFGADTYLKSPLLYLK